MKVIGWVGIDHVFIDEMHFGGVTRLVANRLTVNQTRHSPMVPTILRLLLIRVERTTCD